MQSESFFRRNNDKEYVEFESNTDKNHIKYEDDYLNELKLKSYDTESYKDKEDNYTNNNNNNNNGSYNYNYNNKEFNMFNKVLEYEISENLKKNFSTLNLMFVL